MKEPLRALTLVSCENDKLELHEDVLQKVLESPEARNRPVAVISIAGMFRKGKSFFLNFVLRYLKSQCNENWIQSQTGPLEGFDWKPNNKGVTSGITIWPEVFVVNEVAIVLMDTQGLYETSKNTKEDTYIMVLSTLFSSFQILNYHENLNAADLNDFEFFAKYGLALESVTKNMKGFQNLMFLIRDWKFASRHQYGLESGNKYIDQFLKAKINEDLHSVHGTLKHFEKVGCFLMPYPGDTVSRNEQFRGELKGIKPIFLENMKNFVEYLIATVEPKKVLGKEATGETLVPVMKMYVEFLNDGKLPVPKSLLQLQKDLLQKESGAKCMKIYNDKMLESTKDNLLNKTEMEKLNNECLDAALAEFDTFPTFGTEEQSEATKMELATMIKASEYVHYLTTMEEKVESKLQEIFQQLKTEYSLSLIKIRQTKKSLKKMEEESSKCREKTITDFKTATKFGDTERIEELLKLLIQFMNEEYEDDCGSTSSYKSSQVAIRKIFKFSNIINNPLTSHFLKMIPFGQPISLIVRKASNIVKNQSNKGGESNGGQVATLEAKVPMNGSNGKQTAAAVALGVVGVTATTAVSTVAFTIGLPFTLGGGALTAAAIAGFEIFKIGKDRWNARSKNKKSAGNEKH